MASLPLRVLVVDDTRLYRDLISATLNSIAGVEVVGTAANGEIALARLAELNPDLLTLDVEMPVMDGLTTLRKIREFNSSALVVMVSAHTRQGATVTLEALRLGAYDFITKPEENTPAQGRKLLENKLRLLVNAILTQRLLRQAISAIESRPPSPPSGEAPVFRPGPPPERRDEPPPARPAIVAIGISTGGPNALSELLPSLPADLPVPVVIVQHMPKLFTGALAEALDAKCAIRVVEARDRQRLEPGVAYLAQGGRQMRVEPGPAGGPPVVRITDDPPENHCQPSADYLFRSLAALFKGRVLAVIMTGMGCDGTLGLRLMKRQGAQVIAQDQTTSVVYGMPQEAVKAGVVDVVLPLSGIAPEILRRL